jgi:hypothetical protein
MHTKFLFENPKGRQYFGDLHVDGKIILKIYLIEVACEGVEWTNLA